MNGHFANRKLIGVINYDERTDYLFIKITPDLRQEASQAIEGGTPTYGGAGMA